MRLTQRARRCGAAAAVLLLVTGCASTDAPFRAHLESAAGPVRDCAQWFRQLDEQTAQAGAGDAQDTRIEGFPYLRTSRLLSALRATAVSNDEALHALADRMLSLDLEARRYELMNLPAGRITDVGGALGRTQQCGRLLREIDLAKREARDALLDRADVPDDYLLHHRILGLYALTRFAFAQGIRRYEQETRGAFARDAAAPAGALPVRVAPPPGAPLSHGRAARIMEHAAANPLGIPEPGEPELQEMLAAYAPSFEIAMSADFDRFGALRWTRDGGVPEVDGGQLVAYAHPAWTIYRGRVLLQLVYTIWFPERPPQSEGDILAGKLDGVTWRVTLAPDGEPLVYDSIHACGCYHLFFPTPRAHALPAPAGPDEWMFSPQSLPRLAPGERPLLRLASGTHAIERVGIVRGSDSLARYELRPYGELRSMQRLGPGRASAFGPDGIVRGTERPERYYFWPMGIRSAGAMRQWGRHATAFVGRRHFDDADLFEKRFRFDLD